MVPHEAEIQDNDPPTVFHEDVRRLDVPVDFASFVQGLESLGKLPEAGDEPLSVVGPWFLPPCGIWLAEILEMYR